MSRHKNQVHKLYTVVETCSFTIAVQSIQWQPCKTHILSLPAAPTAPPSTPQVSELTAQSFNLIWQPPPFEATNGEIRQYILAIVEVETELTFEVTANSTQMIVGSLHPHYNYLCKVQAVTVDSGPFSEIISVHLLESGTRLMYSSTVTEDVLSHARN